MARGDERRTTIADAVLTVLSERGSRGLTHRAVDEVAGLPTGSTSYYFRSRVALVETAVNRLADLDLASLEAGNVNDPHSLLRQVLEDTLHGPGRERTLARYELVLEGARRPEVRATMEAGTARLQERLADLFSNHSADERRLLARDVMAYLDGLILANVTRPPSERQPVDELADRLTRFIDTWQPRT